MRNLNCTRDSEFSSVVIINNMGAAEGKNNTSYVKAGDNTAQETTRNEMTDETM